MAIQVTYRRTRRLSMRIVKNGDVHVSAPIGMPKKEVERFIEEHRDWMSICFSAYVLLLPEWCVEHVVVHELCHLLEPSHNARFHAANPCALPSAWHRVRSTVLWWLRMGC